MFINIIAIVMTTIVFFVIARLDYERTDKKLVVAGIVVGLIWMLLVFNLACTLIDKIE